MQVQQQTGSDRGLLELGSVSKTFVSRIGMRRVPVSAVHNVTMTVHEGTTMGIVGESGCGKSTLARIDRKSVV
jgi:ABC-type oligopeptide transport system ATPase subunit